MAKNHAGEPSEKGNKVSVPDFASVNVNANFASPGSEFAFDFLGGGAAESSIWNHLIDNVQAACHN